MSKKVAKKPLIVVGIIAIVVGLIVGFGATKFVVSQKVVEGEQLKLVDPAQYWANHFHQFFEDDTYIDNISFGVDDILRVDISDEDKYCALFKCFNGGDWKYGSQKIKIEFNYTGGVQPNTSLGAMYDSDIEALFKGNKYFVKTYKAEEPFQFFFVVLKPEVVQTYTDNLGSLYGCDTKSAEDLARDIIFRGCKLGVLFCSDKK